jgi:predicted lipoprotein with Yx(FWY)xxD motif
LKTLTILLTTGLLALAGCGDDDDDSGGSAPAGSGGETVMEKEGDAMKAGTQITAGESEFGDMLFDSNNQAIYIFENDPKGESVCYDECAEAWPPVLTEGEPKAGDGVNADLLGTVERRDGKTQVTYADQPLYFYSHEGPGEVRCHNVDLNGGFWWVVGPDGERRP